MRLASISSRLLFLCSGGILLTACGATHFHSTWRDSQFAFQGLRKALIVGVVRKQENQRLLEDAFSKEFAHRGVTSTPFYSLAPERPEIPEEDWKRMINDQHIEVIVISRLVDVETIEKQALPKAHAEGSYGYYQRSVQVVRRPVDTTRWKFATVETRVYDTEKDDIVWTGDSRTELNPGFKVDALVREFAQSAVNAMYAR